MKPGKMASIFISLVTSLAVYAGGSVDEAEKPQRRLPSSLIIVGDSIMAGCQSSIDQPFADYAMTAANLVAQHGIRVVNLSRAGNSMVTAEAERADGGVNFTQATDTAIWITLGGNDFLWGHTSLEQYRANYLTFLQRIKPMPGRRIFCVTPLVSGIDYEKRRNSKGEAYEQYRQVVRDIASEGHCTLVDTSRWFSEADLYDECHMPDTVHLGAAGHKRYAQFLLDVLAQEYAAP